MLSNGLEIFLESSERTQQLTHSFAQTLQSLLLLLYSSLSESIAMFKNLPTLVNSFCLWLW
jgi:hypothetical protein